jgi:hypothetical protein
MNKEVKEFIKHPHKLGWFLGFDKLSEIHSYWIKAFWLNYIDYVLMAHRNGYKTTAVIIVGWIWYSWITPESTTLLVREEASNAESTVIAISDLLKKDECRYLYNQLYGISNFRLKKDNANSIVLPTKRATTIEGSLDCIGAGGSVTGRHYKRLAVDDLITINDRTSKVKREKKKLLLQEYQNIKTPDGVMSVSGTPWHQNDGFMMLEKSGIQIDKYPLGSIEIKELTKEKIQKLKGGMSRSLFDAHYNLKHTSDKEKMFDEAKYTEFQPGFKVYGHIDPAYSGTNTTALTLLYKNGEKIIVKGWVFDESIILCNGKISDLMNYYNMTIGKVENNKDEGYTQREISKKVFGFSGYRESQNKHYKIQQYLKANWDNIYFSHDCDPNYVLQIIDYEEGEEPDDAPDSLASALREFKIGEYYNSESGMTETFDDSYEV